MHDTVGTKIFFTGIHCKNKSLSILKSEVFKYWRLIVIFLCVQDSRKFNGLHRSRETFENQRLCYRFAVITIYRGLNNEQASLEWGRKWKSRELSENGQKKGNVTSCAPSPLFYTPPRIYYAFAFLPRITHFSTYV